MGQDSKMKWSRRKLIISGGIGLGLGAVGLVPGWHPAQSALESGLVIQYPNSVEILGIGRRYLQLFGWHADTTLLTRKIAQLMSQFPRWRDWDYRSLELPPAFGSKDFDEFTAWEFESEQTVQLSGWILSETSCCVAALKYLRSPLYKKAVVAGRHLFGLREVNGYSKVPKRYDSEWDLL